jgi:hypothetical protein
MAKEILTIGSPDGYLLTNPATATTATSLTYNGEKALAHYTTCASTNASTSWEPVYIGATMTGTGQVGGRVRIHLNINAVAGAWSNAAKTSVTYGTAGATTGLGSSHCFEMTMGAGTTGYGTYAPNEMEIIVPSGAGLGARTAFMYMAVSGTDKATFDTSGYLFKLDGVSVASGKIFQANTATVATHALRCDIAGTAYYIMLTTVGA